jgi:nucleotide-binding universal stress UspA family protein
MKTETPLMKRPKLTTARAIGVAKKTVGALKIKNVLVTLDFSPEAHAAIRFAKPLLKRFGANLHLVHVLPADSPLSGLADLPMVVPEVEIARRVRRDLGKAAENHTVKTQPGNLHVLRGSPFAEICQLARKIDIDLIVIATRGNTGLKHVSLGSTAERVLRYSPCPVLVVHERARISKDGLDGKPWSRMTTIGRILVPVDFSECSMKGLEYAKRLAKEFDATLILLHSVALQYYVASEDYARYDFPLLLEQSEKAAQKQLRELIAKVEQDGVKAELSLQIGHAGQQICARADVEQADIIVTSTHGYTGLKHVLLGSTAEYVIRHGHCPVLVVPSHVRPVITSTKTQT